MTITSIYLNKEIREHLGKHISYHSLSRRIGCTAERYDMIIKNAYDKIDKLFNAEKIKRLKKIVQTGKYIKAGTIRQLKESPESFGMDNSECYIIKNMSINELIAMVEKIENS